LCNKLTTSTKEGRETWAGKIAQTESMNTFTDQTWSRHVLLAGVVSVASGWWVAVGFVVACCLAAILLMWLLGVSWWVS